MADKSERTSSNIRNAATRNPISHLQRLALVERHQTTTPTPSHAALRGWFKSQYGRDISQSIVSRSLTQKHVKDAGSVEAARYRRRASQWPELESLLDDWLRNIPSGRSKPTNSDISVKAKELWTKSEERRATSTSPQFSAGWVVKYRKRRDLRQRCAGPSRDAQNASSNKPETSFVKFPSVHTIDDHFMDLISYVTWMQQENIVVLSSAICRHCRPEAWGPVPSISSDHLIHLVQHNTFRALISNKDILSRSTLMARPITNTGGVFSQQPTLSRACGGLTTLHCTDSLQLPPTLLPTGRQMSVAHAGLINLFPCPRMRDNLISHGDDLYLEELLRDVFGDILRIFENSSSSPRIAKRPNTVGIELSPLLLQQDRRRADIEEINEDPSDYTAARLGMINWGDPWVIDNWEVTPKLWKKWAWAFEGCEELLRATNRWRASRHEESLIVEL